MSPIYKTRYALAPRTLPKLRARIRRAEGRFNPQIAAVSYPFPAQRTVERRATDSTGPLKQPVLIRVIAVVVQWHGQIACAANGSLVAPQERGFHSTVRYMREWKYDSSSMEIDVRLDIVLAVRLCPVWSRMQAAGSATHRHAPLPVTSRRRYSCVECVSVRGA